MNVTVDIVPTPNGPVIAVTQDAGELAARIILTVEVARKIAAALIENADEADKLPPPIIIAPNMNTAKAMAEQAAAMNRLRFQNGGRSG